jgi:hypothetical protein
MPYDPNVLHIPADKLDGTKVQLGRAYDDSYVDKKTGKKVIGRGTIDEPTIIHNEGTAAPFYIEFRDQSLGWGPKGFKEETGKVALQIINDGTNVAFDSAKNTILDKMTTDYLMKEHKDESGKNLFLDKDTEVYTNFDVARKHAKSSIDNEPSTEYPRRMYKIGVKTSVDTYSDKQKVWQKKNVAKYKNSDVPSFEYDVPLFFTTHEEAKKNNYKIMALEKLKNDNRFMITPGMSKEIVDNITKSRDDVIEKVHKKLLEKDTVEVKLHTDKYDTTFAPKDIRKRNIEMVNKEICDNFPKITATTRIVCDIVAKFVISSYKANEKLFLGLSIVKITFRSISSDKSATKDDLEIDDIIENTMNGTGTATATATTTGTVTTTIKSSIEKDDLTVAVATKPILVSSTDDENNVVTTADVEDEEEES